jgi:hypothetical protein
MAAITSSSSGHRLPVEAHHRAGVGPGRVTGVGDEALEQGGEGLERGHVGGGVGRSLEAPCRGGGLLVELGVAQGEAGERAEGVEARDVPLREGAVVVARQHQHADQVAALEDRHQGGLPDAVEGAAELGHGLGGRHAAPKHRPPGSDQLDDQWLAHQRFRLVAAAHPCHGAAGPHGRLDDQPVAVEAGEGGPVGAGHGQAALEDAPHHGAGVERAGHLQGELEEVVGRRARGLQLSHRRGRCRTRMAGASVAQIFSPRCPLFAQSRYQPQGPRHRVPRRPLRTLSA